jgi:hypothetical protein
VTIQATGSEHTDFTVVLRENADVSTDPTPSTIFGHKVTHELIGGTGKLLSPVDIVLHTTETDGPVPKYPGDAPNAEISTQKGIRLFQPLDRWGSALRHSSSAPYSPNGYCVQVEIVARSKTSLWHLPPDLLILVAAFVAYVSQMHGVPLVVPNKGWKDNGSDCPMPWAANNARRQWAAKPNGRLHNYPAARGVWMHMEVPWQDPSWHWDCGAIARTEILTAAQALITPGGDDDMTVDEFASAIGTDVKHLPLIGRHIIGTTKAQGDWKSGWSRDSRPADAGQEQDAYDAEKARLQGVPLPK